MRGYSSDTISWGDHPSARGHIQAASDVLRTYPISNSSWTEPPIGYRVGKGRRKSQLLNEWSGSYWKTWSSMKGVTT